MRSIPWTIWSVATVGLVLAVGCLTDPAAGPVDADEIAELLKLRDAASALGIVNGNDNSIGGNGNDNGSGAIGDVNCDGVVDNFDIDPFTLALTDPDAYTQSYPNCDITRADVNADGLVNNFDIDPFVALLTGGGNENVNGGGNENLNGGGNENLNGANGNDNSGEGTCPNGSIQVETEMFPGDSNDARYRLFPSGCERFRARIRDFPVFQAFDVSINGVVVGQIFTDDDGRGELEYDSDNGNFPPDFPVVMPGDVIDVGGMTSGTFQTNCSGNDNCNGSGNGNFNG